MHSFVGATAAGLGTAAGFLILREMFHELPEPSLRSETTTRGILLGGLLGGTSHPFLDGLMHTDLRPFWPWSPANPFLDLMSLPALHGVCALAGAVGLLLLLRRLRRERTPRNAS